MRISKWLAVAGGLAGSVLLAAAPARADMISYDSYSVVNNTNVTIGFTGIPPGPYGSGQIDSYQNGNLVAASWCIDVTHDLQGSGSWDVVDASENMQTGMSNIDNGGGNGQLLSWQLLGELGALSYYGDQNLSANPYVSAAVQLAIWNLEYGASITTTSASSQVQSLASVLAWDAKTGKLGSDTDVAWLMLCGQSGCNQGQLEILGAGNSVVPNDPFTAVPEPSSLPLLGAGLLTLIGLAFLRKRRGADAFA